MHGDSDSADDEDEESMSSSDSSFHIPHSKPRPLHRVTPLPSDLERMNKGNVEKYSFVVLLHFCIYLFSNRFVLCSHRTLFWFFFFLDQNLIGGYSFLSRHFVRRVDSEYFMKEIDFELERFL